MRGDVPAIGGYHELAAGPVTLHLGSALLGWDAALSTGSSFPCREGVFADAAPHTPRTTERSGLGASRLRAAVGALSWAADHAPASAAGAATSHTAGLVQRLI